MSRTQEASAVATGVKDLYAGTAGVHNALICFDAPHSRLIFARYMVLNESREAIILAGGLGTRLRGVIGGIPKCMAPVNGRPFLYYLLRYLEQQQVDRAVLSLGYKSEDIIAWLKKEPPSITIDFVIEEKPLGTGGGIRLAMGKCQQPEVFVVNGDTMFTTDLTPLMDFHRDKKSATSISLKSMQNAGRYGTVQVNEAGMITSFEEKSGAQNGLINGGIYIINRASFLQREFPGPFSFEKEYLERFVNEGDFYGYMSDAYFIDIGVPEDYGQAQTDFQTLFPA